MSEVGIRALKQNASAVVAAAATGETVIVSDRGRPVAQLTALPTSRLAQLVAAGKARPPLHDIHELPAPEAGPSLSAVLQSLRDDERY